MKQRVMALSLGALFLVTALFRLGLAPFAAGGVVTASEPTVLVRVIIERVRTTRDCDDSPGAPCDFLPYVLLDNVRYTRPDIEDQNDISPGDWVFTSDPIPISRLSVPVDIRIWDADAISDPDLIWLTPYWHANIVLAVNLVPCAIESVDGDTPSCNTTIVSSGDPSGDHDWAEISYRIEVIETPYAPGLRVRCLHSPIWPQPGDSVTITAEALDGALRPRIADRIEIWVNDRTAPRATTAGVEGSTTVGPLTGDYFTYNCKVVDDGVPVSTGWHLVSIGDALAKQYGGIAPVYYNGSRTTSIDVLFHADADTYPAGPRGGPFLAAVRNIILTGYFAGDSSGLTADYISDFMLLNQYRLNFWIAPTAGHVAVVPGKRACTNLSVDQPFEYWSDSKLVVHDKQCDASAARFGASGVFAIRPNGGATIHETGHAVFGLADEYCCDSFYRQPDPLPNIYESEDACKGDAPNVGRPGSECHRLLHPSSGETNDWWTSDPSFPDLMGPYHGRPNLLDLRRIDWKFGKCQKGKC